MWINGTPENVRLVKQLSLIRIAHWPTRSKQNRADFHRRSGTGTPQTRGSLCMSNTACRKASGETDTRLGCAQQLHKANTTPKEPDKHVKQALTFSLIYAEEGLTASSTLSGTSEVNNVTRKCKCHFERLAKGGPVLCHFAQSWAGYETDCRTLTITPQCLLTTWCHIITRWSGKCC